MKKEDKWLEALREKLADYSEPVPETLWNDLEKELEAEPPRRMIPWWHRWQRLAAVVTLLVAVSALLWWQTGQPVREERGEPWPTVADKTGGQVSEEPMPSLKLPEEPWLAEAPVRRKQPARTRVECPEPMEEAVPSPTEVAVAEKEEKADGTDRIEPALRQSRQQPASSRSARPKREKPRSRWSVGLSAGHATLGYSTGYRGYGRLGGGEAVRSALSRSDNPAAYEKILFNNLYQQNISSDMEHRTPVSVGLSVRWELPQQWAVESGLFYTLLSSELRSGNADYWYKDEQRLHYVGVPLRVSRELWAGRRFSVYATVGGAVEKCVSGRLTSLYTAGEHGSETERRKLDVDELQWSLSAAAGAQLHLNGRMGVYLEPGLSWYPDDGSGVQTIRKEHPLNFNLQLGFRWTFAK